MARSRFTATIKTRRWVGSLEDAASLVERTRDLTVKAAGEASCTITVKQPGLTLEYAEPDEFRQQTTLDDLDRIEDITANIYIHANDGASTSVYITFSPGSFSDPVSATIAGPDRTIVEGLKAQLKDVVEANRQFPRSSGAPVAFGLGCAIVIVGEILFLAYAGQDWPIRSEGLANYGLLLAGLAVIIGALAAPWHFLFPSLEWLPADGRSKWDRSRSTLSRMGKFVLGALVIALIGGLIKYVL